MHAAQRRILTDLRVLTPDAKARYLTMLRESLATHGALMVPYKDTLVALDAPQWERFFTAATA